MTLKVKIMLKAVKIRMEQGENIEEILASYPRLSSAEKDEIRSYINAEVI